MNIVTGNYILNIPCYYDSGPDPDSLNISYFTTGASNYINIYTPTDIFAEVNRPAYSGKLDSSKYNITNSSNNDIVTIGSQNIKITGLQFNEVYFTNTNNNNVQISSCIFYGSPTNVITINGSGTIKIWNNIFYSINWGPDSISGATTVYFYNNTEYNCWNGCLDPSYGTWVVKNNIAYLGTAYDYYSPGSILPRKETCRMTTVLPILCFEI